MPSRRTTPESAALLSPQLLAEARSGTARTWAAHALCIGADPELFFPPGDGPAIEARRICGMCPVRGQCLAYAVTADEPFGIWGGLDPHERENLRRQFQRREPSADSHAGSAA
jgi:WhiB family transcriptional regulator, redox-sensing transcriptional regulator